VRKRGSEYNNESESENSHKNPYVAILPEKLCNKNAPLRYVGKYRKFFYPQRTHKVRKI
jgi:hypothetical protein